MCYKDCFKMVLSAVSRSTELPKDIILSNSKKEEVVDARHMLVYVLRHHYNMKQETIGDFTHCTSANISYILRHFDNRKEQRRLMGMQYQSVCKELESKSKTTI